MSLATRPSLQQLRAARGKGVLDLVAPDLKLLFIGINPGLYSAAVGHHFARPGNRFWPALHQGGFTARVLSPFEERELLGYGYGITNLFDRATATADQVSAEELRAGAERLLANARRWRPRWVAFVGIGAYRTALGRPKAQIGRQEEMFGEAHVWVLPNPSGLNAHYSAVELGRLFGELRAAVEAGA